MCAASLCCNWASGARFRVEGVNYPLPFTVIRVGDDMLGLTCFTGTEETERRLKVGMAARDWLLTGRISESRRIELPEQLPLSLKPASRLSGFERIFNPTLISLQKFN